MVNMCFCIGGNPCPCQRRMMAEMGGAAKIEPYTMPVVWVNYTASEGSADAEASMVDARRADEV